MTGESCSADEKFDKNLSRIYVNICGEKNPLSGSGPIIETLGGFWMSFTSPDVRPDMKFHGAAL